MKKALITGITGQDGSFTKYKAESTTEKGFEATFNFLLLNFDLANTFVQIDMEYL